MYKLFKRAHDPGRFEVQMAGACDPGMARDHNEDAIALHVDEQAGYFIALVCDGMGGHNAGEVASAIAVDEIGKHLAEHYRNGVEVEQLLHDAFNRANQQIDDQASLNPEARGMGCTAVMIFGTGEQMWVAHAGDSRGYRLRAGDIVQITSDHTMVQEMVDNGLITEEQASVHPYRGRISRCLGHGKNKGDPTVTAHLFERGDNLLVCSDGLSDVVDKDEIGALIGQRDVRSSARRLIEAANKAGGPDNISAIVVRRTL